VSDDKSEDSKPAADPIGAAAPAATDATTTPARATAEAGSANLASLMATGKRAAPDLEQDALRAAEAALAEGERALAAARAQLQPPKPSTPPRNRRELALRALLAVNVLAMVTIAMLPAGRDAADAAPAPHEVAAAREVQDAQLRRFNEPFNNALAAADRGEFVSAIAILERYLADNPRMAPSQRLNVLNMLSHYAANANDFAKSQQWAQQAAAIGQSHSLPADLVEMAKQALANGDQESLRRVWARFLLQQRQIPSWLYRHVAEAYLQLGDSYRKEADDAAERARRRELEELAARMREQALQGAEKGK
jgi:hypothetical protein